MNVLNKRFVSLLLIVMILFSMIPISTISTSAAGGVKAKLDSIIKTYPNGSRWTSSFDGGIQCYGFGKLVIYNIFGKSTVSGYTYRTWKYDGSSSSGMNVIGSITSYSSTNVKNLLSKAKPGDVLQFNTTKQHTMIVYEVASDGVWIYDCNWDNNCGISLRKSAFGAWSGRNSSKLTLLRSDNYASIDGEQLTKLTKYPTPIKDTYTKATGNTIVYNYPNGSAIQNKIYDTDPCTINAIYTNGWCKVTFPLDTGGTDSGYVKTSVFFDSGYDIFKITAGAEITTYPRSNLSGSFGYTGSGDVIYVIGHTSSAVQILYPLTGGGYKAGWVPISYFTFNIKYNANGGTGTMSSSTVKFQNKLTLATNKFTKTGHAISGWNCYRSSDKTWSVKGGWKTATQITNDNLSKYLYPTSTSGTLEESWLTGGKTKDTFTFYAVWKPNTLSVYYNANGASISSDTYKLSNNLIYNKSDSSKFAQTWTYNSKKSNGLTNCGTFGLSKTGHHFKGWGTSSSGGTIFDHNNIDLLPATINSNLKTGNCSTTLYAIWEPNTLGVSYKANGGTISSDTYTLLNDYINTKSDNAKFVNTWTYNSTKTNGLYNAKTFGLTKEGYRFVGWSTKADGSGTIFNQDDTTITPTDLTSTIKTSNCTLDLYAIWEKVATEPPTEKPTEIPTVIPTETIVELGDVDKDGSITIMDTTMIQRHIAQEISLTDQQLVYADTDKDTKISIMDATAIQRFIAKMITSF